jgi:hypothetical protein
MLLGIYLKIPFSLKHYKKLRFFHFGVYSYKDATLLSILSFRREYYVRSIWPVFKYLSRISFLVCYNKWKEAFRVCASLEISGYLVTNY